ncbi:replication factor-a protein [Ophiostoma piceae UAMH 11346]|uniref:Replication factor-a protein n=1 Tax=Ophiostoma piceae (strain UAMH 11346) TaxID=1262450 RepID=S3C023_OPHP1|nr:replication factor-a protein [Ophiostoma piceae UAMH 11346]
MSGSVCGECCQRSSKLVEEARDASYGTYSKPSYGGGGDGDGGGYMAGSQQGSQGREGGRNYEQESLRPVTIKQLLECEESYPGSGQFQIDGKIASQITIVGQVLKTQAQATNTMWLISDGSGQIEVTKWADKGADADETTQVSFGLDQFVRVYGRIKTFNQKRSIQSAVLRPIEDFNEVNYHILECAYHHLTLTRGSAGDGSGAGANGADGNQDADGGMFVQQNKLTPNGQKVYNFLRNAPTGFEGLNINVIANEQRLSMDDTMAALNELLYMGWVYNTTDESTFALVAL